MSFGASTWWGPLALPDQGYASLQLGPLHLLASRADSVLQLAWRSEGDPLDARFERSVLDAWDPPDGYAVQRFAVGSGTLRLAPRLPDRFVVARPEQATVVPAGGRLVAYLSAPMWVAVLEGEVQLADLPVYRPSDTWFGPSTIEGELGYALRTSLKTSHERLFLRPHRAVTRVSIENRGALPLEITRLRLPMGELSLYRGEAALWTEELRLVRSGDDDNADVTVGRGAPPEAGKVELVAAPRSPGSTTTILRVFNSLFRSLER